MKSTNLLIAVIGAVSLSACATVTRGSNDKVEFTSDPSGATITTEDVQGKELSQSCVTPCELKLSRKRTFDITYTLEGYETQVLRIEPKLSGGGAAGMAGNVLIGGVIGAAVDGSTGAMNNLEPNPLNAVLIKNGESLDVETTSTDAE